MWPIHILCTKKKKLYHPEGAKYLVIDVPLCQTSCPLSAVHFLSFSLKKNALHRGIPMWPIHILCTKKKKET